MSGAEPRVARGRPDFRDVCTPCLGDLVAVTRRLVNLGLGDLTVSNIAALIGDELLAREMDA